MIEPTQVIEGVIGLTSETDILRQLATYFLPSIIFYWIFVFLIMLFMGYALIKTKEGRANFFAVFIFVHILSAVILFLTFVFPVIPQLLNKIF